MNDSSFWNPGALHRYVKATVELTREDAHAYAVLYTRRSNDLSLAVVRQDARTGDSTVSAFLTTEPEFQQHALENIVQWIDKNGNDSVFVDPGILLHRDQ